MRGITRAVLFLFLAIFLASLVYAAPDEVISNSADWRDVYSSMLYGSLLDAKTNFLVSTRHGTLLLGYLPKDITSIEIVSSRRDPYVVDYASIVRNDGFQDVTELAYDNVNLELARRLANVTNFIIIDDAYGYNAISVAPYAVVSKSYVLFSNRRNIGAVSRFLADRTVDSLIIYGQVDREVKTSLAGHNPEIINLGDRFENNQEIVKKYLQIKPTQQVILTNGEFIEQGIMSGTDPVVFIGRVNVPDPVRTFIKEQGFSVGILIGNELVGAATSIRRQLGISVFVKFAQSARAPSGTVSKVEDLDRFYLPRYSLNLEIVSVVYNEATGSLEVTYRNNVTQAIYFKSTITLNDDETPPQKRVGDADPIFIDGNSFKTVFYDKTTDGQDINLIGDNLSGTVSAIYGDAPNSLEFLVEKDFDISRVTVMDDSELKITDAYYEKGGKRFMIVLENTGPVDVYSKVEIVDLWVNGEYVTVASQDVMFLKAGETLKVPVNVEMLEEDFDYNELINVRAYYGERQDALIKIARGEFPLKFGGVSKTVIYAAAIIVVILLLILFLKKKCRHCKTKNNIFAKKCRHCGMRFR